MHTRMSSAFLTMNRVPSASGSGVGGRLRCRKGALVLVGRPSVGAHRQ